MEDRHETLFIYKIQDKNERCELFSMQVVRDDDEGGRCMGRCTRRKTLLKIYSLINRRLRIYGYLSEWIQENYTQLFKLTSRQRYVVDESVSGVNASGDWNWDWDGAADGSRRIPIDSIHNVPTSCQ